MDAHIQIQHRKSEDVTSSRVFHFGESKQSQFFYYVSNQRRDDDV